jgi:DNA-binding CsgD family transcriptional regulator
VTLLIPFSSSDTLRSSVERLVIWIGDAPVTWPRTAKVIHVTAPDRGGADEISAALARVAPEGPLPAIVLSSSVNTSLLASHADKGIRSPLLVLVGVLHESPMVFSRPCLWVKRAPSSVDEWAALLRAADNLEAERLRDLDSVMEAFCMTFQLSPREARVVRLAVDGLTNDETSAVMGCSRPTISTYWNRVFKKVGLTGQREVIACLVRHAMHGSLRTTRQDPQGDGTS